MQQTSTDDTKQRHQQFLLLQQQPHIAIACINITTTQPSPVLTPTTIPSPATTTAQATHFQYKQILLIFVSFLFQHVYASVGLLFRQ